MKALFQVYNDNKGLYPCKAYFDPNRANDICNNNLITLDRYEGVIMWVIAFYQDFQNTGGDIDAAQYISNVLRISKSQFNETLLKSVFLNTTLNSIQVDFQQAFGCFSPPCDRKFLAERQFYQSSITNMKSPKYPSLNVLSVALWEENYPLLKNKIPEIYGFYKYYYNYEGKIFGGEQDKLFNNGVGRASFTQGPLPTIFSFS